MKNLEIRDLHVCVEDKEILKGVDLSLKQGESHVLMGPNGNGKSTLLAAIMGDPRYTVTSGSIIFDDKDILKMPVNERSIAGIFLGMQYPQEINGVTNSDFLRAAMNVRRDRPVSLFQFIKEMEKTIDNLKMSPDLAHRFLNEGFSGGEKKRNEIVQMQMLKPSLAMLDEIDSGLDVDAIRIVADAINRIRQENNMSLLIVSHYDRFLELIKPEITHVLINGRIVMTGGPDLYQKIDQQGYDWIYEQYNIEPEIEQEKKRPQISIGSCAVRETLKGAETK
ncbi:MAG: Fe-S cluster assembly ATPase SufC [Erysipelotrichaceae bacterium]|nr:Fe-S cluster assembly ATPase SufC [Erysipelotrichaceae bacterium]